jgi:uncharacterized membrane protein
VPRDLLIHRREWILRRNCSLTPRQTLLAYALLLALSLGIGGTCALNGAPLVLAFSALDMSAVTAAYLYYSCHALDHERIVLHDGGLLVERTVGTRVQRTHLDPARTRVRAPARAGDLVTLATRGTEVRIGAPLPLPCRAAFARELENELRAILVTRGR